MPSSFDLYFHHYQENDTVQTPPVILLHGAGGNHLYWPSQIRRMPGCRVYALDLPGHGKSGGRGQQTISTYARVVLEWLDEIEAEQTILIGHSMGGAIALTLALEAPERVCGLGLIGSGARLHVAPQIIESAASSTTFHNAIQTVVGQSFSPHSSEQLLEQAARRMAEIRSTVLHGDFLACESFDVSERIAEIQCPTLVVCGAEDKMTPLRSSQFLANTIPHARLEVIPEAGHMCMLEQPQLVAAKINKFILAISC